MPCRECKGMKIQNGKILGHGTNRNTDDFWRMAAQQLLILLLWSTNVRRNEDTMKNCQPVPK